MRLNSLIKSSLILIAGAGCVDVEGPLREPLGASDILSEIRIRSSTIMIAKGDSHQIGFDLIAVNNDTIPIDPAIVRWSTTESQIVPVSGSGVIRGLEVSGAPIQIAVQYEHKYVTRYDTVNVYVTDGKIDVNSIKLVSLDSTRVGAIAFPAPRVRIDLFKNGTLVQKGSLIPVEIDEPATATQDPMGGPDFEPVYRISNEQHLIGKFWVRASLNLYGNEVSDSLSFIGLHGSIILPAISISDFEMPIPVLDTVPLSLFQICATNLIINVSATDTVDILFSDSTASATGCDNITSPFGGLGYPIYGEFVGGNVLRVPPGHFASRKSNTVGVISYVVRKSGTNQLIPWFTNHIRQIDVQD